MDILAELDKSAGDVYIGGKEHNYDFLLENNHSVPECGAKVGSVLLNALKALKGGLKWNNIAVMHNINPQPMIASVAISTICNLYNLNGIWDFVSAGAHSMEKGIIIQLSSVFGWNESDGVFTFGGKGCLTYAVRIGLNRCCKSLSSRGLRFSCEESPVVVTSVANHYTINTVCSLLGIGIDNCIMTPVLDDDCTDIESFEEILEELLSAKKPIACIIISGGNTLHLAVDNVNAVCDVVDKLALKYRLSYKPYIYLDFVVGWPWMFFVDYDFKINKLSIPLKTIKKIRTISDKLCGINRVDGFGVDFHKTGFCPYVSSLFITKYGAELHSIHKDEVKLLSKNDYGNNFSQHHMIEHSRSIAPIFSAFVAMQLSGKNGFRSYIVNMLRVSDVIVSTLSNSGFEYLNPFSCGFASVFCPIRASCDYSYDSLLNSTIEDIEIYNSYVFELFNYLLSKEKNDIGDFILRFLPQYCKARNGENVAVIVVYPMAMCSTENNIKPIAEKIVSVKKKFDKLLSDGERYIKKNNSMPNHVPK
jgi:glutamate/tyrosine decarboxylase-like PLP-dependent enzyme